MFFGLIILFLAVLPLIFDFLYLSRYRNYQQKTKGQLPITIVFVLILFAYLSLIYAFLTNDFSVEAVYSYSSTSLPTISKVSATWSGAGGSLLILLVAMSLTYTVYRFKTVRDKSRHDRVAYLGLDLTLLFFLVLTLGKNPFEATAFTALEGKGLSPALQSPWMAVHPPIVFLSYAFILLGFFLVLARMRTGEKHPKLLNTSVFFAWFLMTLGIILGAVWAYEVLGWGGYWSWDPIETGSLLPWLALTAYFVLHYVLKTKIRLLEDITVLVALLSMFFVSALTRGGLLASVHSYGLSPAGPLLILFGLAILGFFFYSARTRRLHNKLNLRIDWTSIRSISAFLVCAGLALSFLVCFLGIAIPVVQNAMSLQPSDLGQTYYVFGNYPALLLATVGLIGLGFNKSVKPRIFGVAIAGAFVAGVVLTSVGLPTMSFLVDFAVPLVIFGISTTIYSIVSALVSRQQTFPAFTKGLVFLGLFVLVLGVFFSYGARETFENTSVKPNVSVDFGASPIKLQLSNLTLHSSGSQIQYKEYICSECSYAQTILKLQQGQQSFSSTLTVSFYPEYGLMSTPAILSTPPRDIYVHILPNEDLFNFLVQPYNGNQTAAPATFTVMLDVFPYVSLVWVGSAILVVGTCLVTLGFYRQK